MFHSFKKKLLSVVIIASFAFVIFVLIPKQETDAVGMIPFGGTISELIYCPCSNNFLIAVTGPAPATLVFQTGVSQSFSFGQVYRPGPYVLGNYSPGGVCLLYVVVGCVPIPTAGTISIIGTSL